MFFFDSLESDANEDSEAAELLPLVAEVSSLYEERGLAGLELVTYGCTVCKSSLVIESRDLRHGDAEADSVVDLRTSHRVVQEDGHASEAALVEVVDRDGEGCAALAHANIHVLDLVVHAEAEPVLARSLSSSIGWEEETSFDREPHGLGFLCHCGCGDGKRDCANCENSNLIHKVRPCLGILEAIPAFAIG